MKKNFFVGLFVVLCLTLLLNGCSKQSETKETPEQGTSQNTSSESTESKVEMITETPLTNDSKTVLDSYSFDIDGDGTEESIELQTSAERDENGVILWDDGQNWKLTVKRADSEFVLFNSRIQIGMLNHQVFEVDGKLHIAYTLNATAQLAFVHFEYDSEKNVFVNKNEYVNNEGNINVLHHTMNAFDK